MKQKIKNEASILIRAVEDENRKYRGKRKQTRKGARIFDLAHEE